MKTASNVTALFQVCRLCEESKAASTEFFYRKDSKTGRLDTTCRGCRQRYSVDQRAAKGSWRETPPSPKPPQEGVQSCARCDVLYPLTVEAFALKSWRSGRLDDVCRSCRDKSSVLSKVPRRVDATGPTKRCTGCSEVKPAEQFYKAPNRPGVLPLCKICSSSAANQRMQSRIRSSWTKRLIVYAYRNRLKRRGIHAPCDFGAEHLYELYASQRGRCYWTGVQLELDTMGKPCSVSLERLDNDRGYLKGNVVLATRAANLARNTAPVEEFRAFIRMIKEA